MNGKTKFGARINTIISLTVMLTALASTPIHARDVLFLGLTDKKGEPMQASLEQAIRHELSTSDKFRLINETETQRFIRELERLGHNRTERVIPPSARLADSTIIIRGIAEELSFTTGRSWILWGKINARMTIKLYFNEVSGPSSYQGEFTASASKQKDWLFFAKAKKVVHVSAADRSELMRKMQSAIVKETSRIANLFFGALASGQKSADEVNDVTSVDIENISEELFPGVPELMDE